MSEISIIGLDLAKQVFQVHGADRPGVASCASSSSGARFCRSSPGLRPASWRWRPAARPITGRARSQSLATRSGCIPPAYVKPYVKRGKSDRIDAEAICEAASRPTMRFVPVKTIEQQSLTTLHRSRDLLIKTRTMLVNALRAHLAEFGFVAAKGIGKLPDLIKIVSEATAEALPEMVRAALSGFLDAIALINRQLDGIEKQLRAWHKANPQSKRLETAPGVGLIGATALCALVPDPKLFKNGRHFAAWIGLTPRLDGTGGKTRLGRISKAGDRTLRRLFVLGATSLLKSLANKTTPLALWVQGLLARRSRRAVTVALANKLARIAWAIMASGEAFRPAAAAQLTRGAVSA